MHQKVHYQVSLSTTSTTAGEATLLDLSIEGCRMECAGQLSVNTYLSLRLPLTSDEPPILVDLAAVRWVREKDCGIQFLFIQPPQLNRLETFLASSVKSEGPPGSSDR
ncbi:MAG: PilZ domain-containing protein [Nitrospira sp.]